MRTHSLEGRKREERLGELRNVARHKRALTGWRRGRGRSGLVSFETWHVTNEHSLPGGETEQDTVGEAAKRGTRQRSNNFLAAGPFKKNEEEHQEGRVRKAGRARWR